MLELHQFRPSMGLLNASPFCMKVEVYLRMTGTDYKSVTEDIPNGPYGKLPYIVDDGRKIGDSSSILAHLVCAGNNSLDEGLSREQWGKGVAIQRMLEEHTYFALMFFRWLIPEYWPTTRKHLFAHLPGPMRYIVPALVKMGTKKTLMKQGVGRLPGGQVLARAYNDIAALGCLLGENAFILGDEPTSFDATVFAFLANLLPPAPPIPISAEVEKRANLVDYCARMRERFPLDPA